MITSTVNTREFERAMTEIIRLTGAEDKFVLKKTTSGVLINLVRFTFLFRRIRKKRWRWLNDFIERNAKGRARLGWWPAWKALQMPGAPRIGNGPLKDRGEGGIIDESRKINEPSITVFNEVPYIEGIAEKNQTVPRALARQAEFMAKYLDKRYARIMQGRSG